MTTALQLYREGPVGMWAADLWRRGTCLVAASTTAFIVGSIGYDAAALITAGEQQRRAIRLLNAGSKAWGHPEPMRVWAEAISEVFPEGLTYDGSSRVAQT